MDNFNQYKINKFLNLLEENMRFIESATSIRNGRFLKLSFSMVLPESGDDDNDDGGNVYPPMMPDPGVPSGKIGVISDEELLQKLVYYENSQYEKARKRELDSPIEI